MSKQRYLVTELHQSTQRDYVGRMMDEKVHCMHMAKQYDSNYWDGDRRYGYGGYRYIPGRWISVAEKLIDMYGLNNQSKLLDIGCGKGFLLYELKCLLPRMEIQGFDISQHGLNHAKEELKPHLFIHRAQDPLPFEDNYFDLAISLATLHNLKLFELEIALQEMQRVAKQGYMMVESYRNEQELFNLQCWALTAESFLDAEEWIWLMNKFGYTGEYEFIFFE